jgi:phage-related protein
MMEPLTLKPLYWVASSKKDLLSMPDAVQDVFGYALHLAQSGGKHSQAKPLKGFGGTSVIEVVEDFDGKRLSCCLYLTRGTRGLCASLFSKTFDTRD